MKTIFESVTLGNMKIKNRLIRSATMEMGGADNGEITPLLKQIYGELSRGGVGLIISGMMGVGKNACAFPGMAQIQHLTFQAHLRDIVNEVHSAGSKLMVQLAHCGALASMLENDTAPFCPSDFNVSEQVWAKEMTMENIREVVSDFSLAAQRCKEAGADGLEIHAAHGYLLSQFLSPYYNHRTDCYGGCIENRSRIILEIYQEIRQKVGKDYPVFIKINYEDLIKNGLQSNECIRVCEILAAQGIDAAEISSGLAVSPDSMPARRPQGNDKGLSTEGAMKVAAAVKLPVISVGGYRRMDSIEKILNNSEISAFSMSRPLICEPALANRWKQGERSKSRCVSCNQCFGDTFGCKMCQD